MQDYDGRYVWPDEDATSSWAMRIMPYIKNNNVFACPSDGHQPIGPPNPDGIKYLCSYGYNYWLGHDGYRGWAPRLLCESEVEKPAEVVMTFEHSDYIVGTTYGYDTIRQPEWAGGFYWDKANKRGSAPGRHNQRDELTFCDGHAKGIDTQIVRDNWTSGHYMIPGANFIPYSQ